MQVSDDKPYDDINITPMLDLAYVLLVIFILMCTATVQGIKANLPRGGAAASAATKNKIQSIEISPENKIFLNREEVTIEQLNQRLAQAKAANPAVQVVVKGESLTQYASVIQVLNTLATLGISQVGLATKASKH